MGWGDTNIPFETLKGKTIKQIDGLEEGSEEVTFTLDDDTMYRMEHTQDCCEIVRVLEIIGDVGDLIDSEILTAEEAGSDAETTEENYYESGTWTFYKLSTRKGYVDIRWLGESNGYYSEFVDFYEVK
jgi:hypothetical protein